MKWRIQIIKQVQRTSFSLKNIPFLNVYDDSFNVIDDGEYQEAGNRYKYGRNLVLQSLTRAART